jgi:hypothetical protein
VVIVVIPWVKQKKVNNYEIIIIIKTNLFVDGRMDVEMVSRITCSNQNFKGH